jgi:exopolysaccharide production protein ExoQ
MSTLATPQGVFTKPVPRAATSTQPSDSIFGLIVTYAILGPILFIAARGAFSIQGMSFNSRVGGLVTPETGQGSALHSAELIVCYGIMVLVMYPVINRLIETCRANWPLFLLPIWAICSTLWSSEPTRTLSFSILSLVLTVFGIYLAVRFNPRQQLQLVLLSGLVAAVVSFVLIIALPSAGIDYKNATVGAEGIYPSKNACSGITILFLLPGFFYHFPGKWGGVKRMTYIGLNLALIVAALARTGWGVLIILVLFILLLRFMHRLRPTERILVAGFTPAAIALGLWLVYANSGPILKFIGKDPTLSGRTVIWAIAPLAIVKSPIVGFGYDAFFTVRNPEAHRLALAAGDPFLGNAENGVLQMLLELGFVGMFVLSWVLVKGTVNAVRCFRSNTPNYALWYIVLIFYTLLTLVDGNKFMFPNAIEWPIFMMAYVGLENEARRIKSLGVAWT